MREAKNIVEIEGILSEVDLENATVVKGRGTSNEREAEVIKGVIKIKVNQTINGQEQKLEIPVHIFATKMTNSGKLNPAYQSALDVKEKFVSIAACGDEAMADRIRITRGRIAMNEYYVNDTQLASYPRITASFFTKVPKEKFEEKATFRVEFVVKEKEYETNAQGDETGRYKIVGVIPGFGERMDVVPFYVVNNKAIEIMSQYWNTGDTVSAVGKLQFTSTTEKVIEEVDFGEPLERTRTVSISDLILIGGDQNPLEGEFAFTPEEISAGMAKRQAYLEAEKEKSIKRRQTPPAQSAVASGSAVNWGF